MKPAPEEIIAVVNTHENSWRSNLHDLDGNPAVIGFHALEGNLADSLKWTIMLDQNNSELIQPVLQSLSIVIIIGVAVSIGLISDWILPCQINFETTRYHYKRSNTSFKW